MTAVLAAPEAARWLRTPVREGTGVAVVGVAGGVGVTTVTALLAVVLREWERDGDLVVRDVGRDGIPAGAADGPDVVVVVVCGATRAGIAAADDALGDLVTRTGDAHAAGRAVVVAVPVAGRGTAPADLLAGLRAVRPGTALVVLPRSRALAAGGRLPTSAEDPAVHGRAAALAAEVVRAARWVSIRT
ncbi:hypothetical protein [Actinotalea sp. Marseille-Q4924]|uniref:hypothetical protein n=1 Tax=Actinotalea sp. Marseille-Q4924 TaxID=2866571 RepID=UPI001CE4A962|nr:hypothetical protein [Actinotalea sp. Marseille-Q4924]